MRTSTRVIFTLTAALFCTARGAAQGPTASLQAGVTPTEYESEFEIGVRFSPRGRLGVELSVDVYPRYFTIGALAGVADVAFAGNVPLGPAVTVELRAGPSVLGVVAPGGALAAPGYHAGGGIVFTIDSRTALRVDYTYRRIKSGDASYPVPSLTAGLVIHP
jgi:hypothetical protein